MNVPDPILLKLRLTIVMVGLLGITSLAVAHHGNSQAPASSSWHGYLPPGSQNPAIPAQPGQ
jgi:hypothetical protein